jgi:cell division septum initiation protein DivIVA
MTANELRERLNDAHHDLDIALKENEALKDRIAELEAARDD